jgi:hypothetical protein
MGMLALPGLPSIPLPPPSPPSSRQSQVVWNQDGLCKLLHRHEIFNLSAGISLLVVPQRPVSYHNIRVDIRPTLRLSANSSGSIAFLSLAIKLEEA